MYISPDFYWGYASVEGHRPSNEDMHIVQDLAGMRADLTFPLIFAGLYDGHGGTSASSFCREKLHLQLCRLRSFPARIPYALKTAFLYTDKLFIRRDGMEDIMSTSGTTSCVCLQQGSTLFFANAGDSRAIIGIDPASPLVEGKNSRYADELSAIVRIHQRKNNNSAAEAAAAAMEAEDKRRRSTRGLSISSSVVTNDIDLTNNKTNNETSTTTNQDDTNSNSNDIVPVFTLTNLKAPDASLNGDQTNLVTSSYVFRVSKDHKPSLAEEKARIEQSGSYVTMEEDGTSRVAGILSVSRAIGDGPLKKFGLISTPELAAVAVGDVTFIILACDGLWDVMNESQVAACVRRVIYASVLVARMQAKTTSNSQDDIQLLPEEQEVLNFANELEDITKNDPEDVIEDFRFDDDEDISMEEVEALVAKLEGMANSTKIQLEHIKEIDSKIADKVCRIEEDQILDSNENDQNDENAENALAEELDGNITQENDNIDINDKENLATEKATENHIKEDDQLKLNEDQAETIPNPNRFSPDTIAKYLVRMALSLGTTDNVTVIVGVAKNIMPKTVRRSLESINK